MDQIEQQAFSIFSSFIQDLSKTYPEIRNCLYRNYEDCITKSEKKSLQFKNMKNILQIKTQNFLI